MQLFYNFISIECYFYGIYTHTVLSRSSWYSAKVTNLLYKNNCFITDVDSDGDSQDFSRITFQSRNLRKVKSEFILLKDELNLTYFLKIQIKKSV